MTLADPDGKAWRTTYQKLSDDDTKYLHGLADAQEVFRPMKGYLKPIDRPIASLSPPGMNPLLPNRNPPFGPGSSPPIHIPAHAIPQPNFPNIPAPQPVQPFNPPNGSELVAICEGCKRTIPDSIKAGDHCPHCGTYFEYEVNADGSRTYAPGHEAGKWIGIGVFVLLLFAGVARRFSSW
jgi:hypothetical protein